ncbi:hypothetical protein HHK36_021655 [Tetracentron sinense]|uniref:LETM1-like protein n=1 Tax=Tetracentron sinense TaxID=13715 RepID=A0A834YXF1_TETSI|nr:hypothetical protein HHK36_021655 [Tetracentron sinense]
MAGEKSKRDLSFSLDGFAQILLLFARRGSSSGFQWRRFRLLISPSAPLLCNCGDQKASPMNSNRWFPSEAFSSIASPAVSDHANSESGLPVGKSDSCEMGFNRVDCLVQVLHRSARSFSVAIQFCEMARRGPELAKAWIGVDVHAWQKHIAYQAAVYALLKTAIEVRFLLSDERHNSSPVHDILSPKINLLGEYIESQLNMRDPKLVQWFNMVKLPLLAGSFIPFFKRWSSEYAKSEENSLSIQISSGVAAIILAINSCLAVERLGAGRISCPVFTVSIQGVLGELMDLAYTLASMEKLYHLACKAGFEQEFLTHFGMKAFPNKTSREVEFWIGLVHKKLSLAFHRESVISGMQAFQNGKVKDKSLATLGLFAFLGRSTRLFLSGMGIKDLDAQVKDFLSYLECGSLFIYSEFSSLPVYQLFMEVVTEEIGWLDFYAAIPCISHQERRRSKQHVIQAEKEIILSTVFSVCSDIFSGFAHFSSSTQEPLDANLVAFFLRSQNLLSICLEDYWSAYDRSGELLKIAERGVPEPIPSIGTKGATNLSTSLDEVNQKPADLISRGSPECIPKRGSHRCKSISSNGMAAVALVACAVEQKPISESLLKKSSSKLISKSCDICMGTQLLFMDISVALCLFMKKLRGHNLTEREKKKLTRTVVDIASTIPLAILMLLPVSAVGHAAMFAAINKYIPFLIPSPYSSERLDVVKQLRRTKKMEVHSWSNLEDVPSTVVL